MPPGRGLGAAASLLVLIRYGRLKVSSINAFLGCWNRPVTGMIVAEELSSGICIIDIFMEYSIYLTTLCVFQRYTGISLEYDNPFSIPEILIVWPVIRPPCYGHRARPGPSVVRPDDDLSV